MAERIRFYMDQHAPVAVTQGLRRREVDVLTAQEADRCGFSDREQLRFAQAEGRVLVTFDDDFLAMAAGDAQHAGIAFCAATQYAVGELIYVLLFLHDLLDTADMKNHIEFL